MMKKIMLAALGATCIVSGLYANVSATGFFVEANVGGNYNKIKEYYKHSSQDKKDMTEVLEASKKFAMFLGGGLGYGYEFTNGFYVGGRIYGSYNFAKIEGNAADGSNKRKITYAYNKEIKSQNIEGSYKIEAKPLASYGASIHVGYKVVPNVLVYVGLGGEGTYNKVKQFIEFDAVLLRQGNIAISNWTTLIEQNDQTVKQNFEDGGNDELKINTFAIVPEVGFKFFLSSNMFVGGNVAFPIGFKKKMDEKYYNKPVSYSAILFDGTKIESVKAPLLKDYEITPYYKNAVNVRYGVTFGYKF